MTHHIIEQNTEEWEQIRLGKFTASSFKNLFLSKTTAGYNNEIYRVVFEKITGEKTESFKSDYMDRGHELEPFARQAYEMESFNDVQPGGFFELDEFVGCSPDGLIGDNGLVEIKCPGYKTMIDYLLTRKLPSEYKWQVIGQLYVTKREWCDFFAYHPKLKPVSIRIYPDQALFAELEMQLNIAKYEVEKIIKKLEA